MSWVQLGRTETVKQRDAGSIVSRTTSKAPASGLSGIAPASAALVCRQFSLMINDPSRLGVEVLMFAVYKSNGTNEELASHNELAWGTVDSNHLLPDEYCRLALNTIHSKHSSMAAFQEMNADLNLRLPSEVRECKEGRSDDIATSAANSNVATGPQVFNGPEPVAYIGICYTTSVPLTRRVYTSAHRLSFKTPPYSHKIYGFQSLTGRVLTREEVSCGELEASTLHRSNDMNKLAFATRFARRSSTYLATPSPSPPRSFPFYSKSASRLSRSSSRWSSASS